MLISNASNIARSTIVGVFTRSVFTASSPKCFQISPSLWAEPLKKKKRIDPQIVRAREERRKKKVEKAIRRLEKNQRQLKPIEEVEVPLPLLDNKERRERKERLLPDKLDEIALLKKDWSRHMLKQHLADAQMLDRIVSSQQRALQQLRLESEDLYQAAVQIDEKLTPFTFNGPVDTPAIENYDSPDGEYVDISKKWV